MNFRRNVCVELMLVILAVTFDESVSVECFYDTSNDTSSAGKPLYVLSWLRNYYGHPECAQIKAKVSHPQLPDIPSYAGYFTVNKNLGSNLFFWYFPARESPETAPVVLFVEGGPGVSSFYSIFLQNGQVDLESNIYFSIRKKAWNRKHHMLYIDSPVGSGYSFTQWEVGYPSSTQHVVKDLWAAVYQFFWLFPALNSNRFYVFGESYAGKLVPALTWLIHQNNIHLSDDNKINLAGMVIGNGFMDPVNQLEYSEHLYEFGLVSQKERDRLSQLEKKIQYEAQAHFDSKHPRGTEQVTPLFGELDSLVKKLTGYSSMFNLLDTKSGRNKWEPFEWVQKPDVRGALHVGKNKFSEVSLKVRNKLRSTFIEPEIHNLTAVLNNYPVLIYNGNLDAFCSYTSVERYLKNLLNWRHVAEYKSAKREFGYDENGKFAWYLKKAGNLYEVLIRNSGHLSMIDQPSWTLEVLEKFTFKKF
ncbi:venom serine carboxypeptidase-like [Venturia canescens]|uniref:venom serine carboxypeptidase-like n=1 Tax=Venturia canescens TaxID=32260 RepID=UPI001C9CE3C3|nr:venom serine carboxypeptidase-like [Venturia canescens]